MKHYNTSDRNTTIEKYRVPLTKYATNQGWTSDIAEMYYLVDEFSRTITLCLETKYDNGDYKIVRWNQYADHRGGSFTVSDEQQRKFNNQFNRVKKLSTLISKK